MNFEEVQRIHNLKREKEKQINELAQYQKQNLIDYLNTHKIFKKLLENRLDIYNECKKYIILTDIFKSLSANNGVSKDYISGFTDGIQHFGKMYEEYYKKLEEYNN